MREPADLTVPLRLIEQRRPTRSGTTVMSQAVLAGILVALISVLVTALVATPLAARAANRAARAGLATQADVVAEMLRNRIDRGTAADEERLVARLRKLDVEIYLITGGAADRPGLPSWLVTQVAGGDPVTNRGVLVGGVLSIVEGRHLGDNDGVVLAQPAATGLVRQVLSNLWLPLLAGLSAGVLAGVLLGRRLARPIRNAATAAARLSSGDRRVRLAVGPPAEVERLAESINELAGALTVSEARQREFLLSISHELRTPLTTIRGYAEALSDGVLTAPQDTATVGQTMLAEAVRLDRLVADLLSLARLEAADFPIELVDVELTGLMNSAAMAFVPRCAQHGVRLSTELTDYPITIRSDPTRLRQIVDGLLENALRVVPPGQPVVLAVRLERDDADRPESPSRTAVLEVRDGGPGLTDDDLRVAFDRGALHQRYQGVRKVGSGLGLALAAGLARRLGGVIAAGHAREGGARFTVRLPANP